VNDCVPAVAQAYEGSKNKLNAHKKNLLEGSLATALTASLSVVVTSATQVTAAASVPTLMSLGATVVPGVGSIMPWWIAPIQAFSVAAPFVLVPAAVGGGIGAATYTALKYSRKSSPTEPSTPADAGAGSIVNHPVENLVVQTN